MNELQIAERIIERLFKNSTCKAPIERKKDRLHSLKTREWVLKLDKDASIPLQIAALAHDIDRTIEERRVKTMEAKNYEDYKKLKEQHAKVSADIICEELEKAGIDGKIIERVRYLVEHHERGGDVEANILRDADSLTFFSFDIIPFFKGRSYQKTKDKIKFMYSRLSDKAKELVKKMRYKNLELKNLVDEVIK
ncbi:MAG: DUF4202 family protein [Candidatus Aenigmarchaeota archaeon]|nr:DUF4202 family protein [Candidatus Aenigmarchaeota archaeon]